MDEILYYIYTVYTLDLEFSGIHFFSFANTSCTSKITKQTFIYLLDNISTVG